MPNEKGEPNNLGGSQQNILQNSPHAVKPKAMQIKHIKQAPVKHHTV